ncbi:MAG: magnesium/cobalt transporter CorA [Candidatus Woesearchaeota archaeon]
MTATVFHYKKGLVKEKYTPETLKRIQSSSGKYWIDMDAPTQEELKLLSENLGIHPLVIEDISMQSTRPKMDHYDDYTFFVTFAVEKDNSAIHLNEVDYIIGKNYVVSTHKKPVKEIELFKSKEDRISSRMSKGQDFLLHHLIDMQVDAYFPVLESIEEEMDAIESKVVSVASPDLVKKVVHIKRKLLLIRRVVSPFRDIVSAVTKNTIPNMSRNVELYFRDVYDHILRVNDMIDTNREIISTILEVHLSATSNRLNEIMRVLTVFSTILLPLTFIASLYGMNFRNMPELYHPYGYFITLSVMGLIAIGMLGWFKHKKWI